MSTAARKAWIVAASIGAVEALKDQGFCRWNYALRSVQLRAKTNVRSYLQAQRRPVSSSAGSVISNKMREEKAKRTEEKAKRTEERLGKVMELDCWGPSTIRF